MGAAQASLHNMALLQPDLIMPEILERAYGGLEVVNETHRTTAVLSALSLVALPLVSEHMWLGGQKHIVPLLEMAIPGIDLVRPTCIPRVCEMMLKVCAERPGKDAVLVYVHRLCGAAHQDRGPFDAAVRRSTLK
jgi:proteasome activator subunit 4